MRGSVPYLQEEKGASSAEFALVVIPFLVMVFAIIGVSIMFYANHTLQYAAEAAARSAKKPPSFIKPAGTPTIGFWRSISSSTSAASSR